MKQVHLKIMLVALALEGFLALVFLFSAPPMERTAVFLGDATRLLPGVLTLLLLVPFIWLSLKVVSDKHTLAQATVQIDIFLMSSKNLLSLTTLLIFALVVIAGGIIFLSSPLGDYFSTLRDLNVRLLPLALWALLGLLQALAILYLDYRTVSARQGFLEWKQVFHVLLIPMMILLSIAHWVILFLRLDVFTVIPGWFWGFHEKDTSGREIYFAALLFLALLVVGIILRKPAAFRRNVVFLVAAGYVLQVSFGFIEGHGFESLRQKYANSTHNVYALHAADKPELWQALTEYETLYGKQQFLETKPPGTFFFYNLTQKLSASFCPQGSFNERFYCLTILLAYAYPLLSFLVVILITLFSMRLSNPQGASLPGMLYILLPNVLLMALFLDQVLYPLLFMLSSLLSLLAVERHSFWLALLTGAVAYASIYFSFSLLAILPFSLLIIGLFSIWMDWNASTGGGNSLLKRVSLLISQAARLTAGFFIGLTIVFLFFALVLNYDIVSRYQHAMAFHRYADFVMRIGNTGELAEQALKSLPLTLVIHAFFLNNIEFAAWSGFPVALLALYRAVRTVFRVARRKVTKTDVVFSAFLITLLAMNLFGQTLGEVGRLWLFLSPMLAIFAGLELADQYGKKHLPIYLVVTMQLITTMLTFKFQDFFR